MKKLLLSLVLAAAFVTREAPAQVPTQEQLQAADAQLNQVYQQLRGSLNDAQKQQLKLAQRDWIKKRDSFVAANPGNPQGALYQSTMQRISALQGALLQIQGRTDNNTHTSEAVQTTDKQSSLQTLATTSEVKIMPTPQISGGEVIGSVSLAEDGKCVTIGRRGIGNAQPVAEIWDIKSGSLLHSFITGSEFARTLPDKNILISIGKVFQPGETITGTEIRDRYPTIEIFSTNDRKKHSIPKGESRCKDLKHVGSGHVWHDGYYITRDGRYAIIEERDDETYFREIEDGHCLFQVYLLPNFNKENEKLLETHLVKILTRKELEQMFPETVGINRKTDNSIIKADSNVEFIKLQNGTKVTNKDNGNSIYISSQRSVLKDGLSLSKDAKKIAFYGKNAIRIADVENLHSAGLQIDSEGVEAIAFSPDCKKIAILAFNTLKNSKNAKALSQSEKEYIGIIADSDSGNIVSKTGISNGIVPAPSHGKNELRWIGNEIFLPNGAKFDDTFKFIASLKGCYFPSSSHEPEILVKADELQLADESARRKSSTNVSLIDPGTLNVLKLLPYDSTQADPTCPDLPPFDVTKNQDAILKGWKYWRSGDGGMFIIKGDSKYEYDLSVGGKLPQSCRFINDTDIFIAGPSLDDSQTRLCLISSQDGHSIKPRDGQMYEQSPAVKPITSLDIPVSDTQISSDGHTVYGLEANGVLARYDIHPQEIQHRVSYLCNEKSSLAITPDYFYLSRGNPYHVLGFTKGLEPYPLEQFDLRLNRPDIVLDRLGAPKEAIEATKSLREKRLKRMGVTEEMLQPDFHLPELQIVGDVPATTAKDQLDLHVKATDDKYPLDRLRVYVNNVPVNGRDGELLRDQKTQSLEKTIPIKLAAGGNKIQVSVLNSAGAESLYANAEVTCTAERPKPKLYAVALGVSQYDRPEWCLKYAAKDATDLINKIKEKAGSSYSEVKSLLLTDKDVTKESAAKIKEFLSGATIDDTVLIFMAGHGILDDKYDYYFGTTDIDPAKPSERGMPYEAIDNILAEVPSLKKALLMDTCHAGELDDDEKKELAASDGSTTTAAIPAASTNSSPLAGKVAMRSIGTRGMSVKAVQGAKGKSDWYEKLQDMFVDLRRGSGATVISSSQGAEYAFESSEQSNGLFTYALMEALDGKAAPNKDGQITISTVGDYVKKRVQGLTKGRQNPNLRGVNLEEDFTLSSAK
jgi:uncharacterized protein YecT (DUF1311 family)/uncharacterized caspase-like protein